jgi:hypothetical protein
MRDGGGAKHIGLAGPHRVVAGMPLAFALSAMGNCIAIEGTRDRSDRAFAHLKILR